MRSKRNRPKVGEIFMIPIDNNYYSYGQIVTKGATSDCVVIYDILRQEHPSLDEITSCPIVFFAHTVDVRIVDGLWPVLGNAPVPKNIVFPKYKTETLDGYMILNHEGDIIKQEATESETEELNYLDSWSPESIEKAIVAKYGNAKWEPYYDELIYKG
jgi:hypothetical protein